MAVQVHRVDDVRVVRDRDLDEVALLDDEDGHVGIDAAVDRPLPSRAAVEEAGLAGDRQLEAAVEVGSWRRTASAPACRT